MAILRPFFSHAQYFMDIPELAVSIRISIKMVSR
jgi:hypothetical protein